MFMMEQIEPKNQNLVKTQGKEIKIYILVNLCQIHILKEEIGPTERTNFKSTS
jgi:hypothetical protein